MHFLCISKKTYLNNQTRRYYWISYTELLVYKLRIGYSITVIQNIKNKYVRLTRDYRCFSTLEHRPRFSLTYFLDVVLMVYEITFCKDESAKKKEKKLCIIL